MKKFILSLLFAVLATAGLYAQQISVVSPGGDTSLYRTLPEAIEGAEPGSVIYLPGGVFPISDDVKITKKLTIIGIGHKSNNDNVDGATIINGNLFFCGRSSGSAMIGVYLSGNINVGTSEDAVENLTIKYCNVSSIIVENSASNDMVVNQCYLRGRSRFNYCNVRLENNIAGPLNIIDGGIVNHNVILCENGAAACSGDNHTITNNFFVNYNGQQIGGGNSYKSHNCIGAGSLGDNPIILDEGISWNDLFVANKGVTITSDYSLKDNVDKSKFEGTDKTEIGIYGGTGFNDSQMAPVPYIITMDVKEQTDASGKLNVKFRVKAGE